MSTNKESHECQFIVVLLRDMLCTQCSVPMYAHRRVCDNEISKEECFDCGPQIVHFLQQTRCPLAEEKNNEKQQR